MRTKKYTQLMNFIKRTQCHIYEYGVVHGDSQWRWPNVTSPFHRLYYVSSGEIYLREGQRQHTLTSGHLYLVRRDTLMDYYAEEAFEKIYFHLNYFGHMGNDYLDHLPSVVQLPAGVQEIDVLQEVLNGEDFIRQGALLSFLYEVLDRALGAHPPEDCEAYRVDSIYDALVKEMIKRSSVDFSVEAMARYCGQSTADFSRKFKAEKGLPPKQFLHGQVIEKGKMLLLTTDLSIKEIAVTLGFEDSMYFSRFFRKRVGTAPQKYRRQHVDMSNYEMNRQK